MGHALKHVRKTSSLTKTLKAKTVFVRNSVLKLESGGPAYSSDLVIPAEPEIHSHTRHSRHFLSGIQLCSSSDGSPLTTREDDAISPPFASLALPISDFLQPPYEIHTVSIPKDH